MIFDASGNLLGVASLGAEFGSWLNLFGDTWSVQILDGYVLQLRQKKLPENNKKEAHSKIKDAIAHQEKMRQQEVKALNGDQAVLLQSLNEESDESTRKSLWDRFHFTTNAVVKHKQEIDALEKKDGINVEFTATRVTRVLEIEPNITVHVNGLGSNIGSLCWIPLTQHVTAVDVKTTKHSTTAVTTLQKNWETNLTYLGSVGGFGKGMGRFAEPHGLAVSGGEVFVSDATNNTIQVFKLDGTFLREWGTKGEWESEFNMPGFLAISGKELLVTDMHNNRVQVFGLDGSFLRWWGTKGDADGQFERPCGVAVKDGEVFVCDSYNHRIQVFHLNGDFVRQWDGLGQGVPAEERKLNFPVDVVVNGSEVFVTELQGDRIRVFGLDGSYLRQWGTTGDGEGQFDGPVGIAISGTEVLVSDMRNNRIQIFGLDGSYLRQMGTKGQGDGQFQKPVSVCVDEVTGMVCVSDSGNHRWVKAQ